MGHEIFGVQENCCLKNLLWKVTNMPLRNKLLLQVPQKLLRAVQTAKRTVKRDFEIHQSRYLFPGFIGFSEFRLCRVSKKNILAFISNGNSPCNVGCVSGNWVSLRCKTQWLQNSIWFSDYYGKVFFFKGTGLIWIGKIF